MAESVGQGMRLKWSTARGSYAVQVCPPVAVSSGQQIDCDAPLGIKASTEDIS